MNPIIKRPEDRAYYDGWTEQENGPIGDLDLYYFGFTFIDSSFPAYNMAWDIVLIE